MKKLAVALLFGTIAMTGVAADAQKPTRVRGAIATYAGGVLSVKSQDGNVTPIRVTDKTTIVYAQPIPLSEIKPGDFLAVTSKKYEDGTLKAYEVRRFPKPVNPGHRPYSAAPDSTMTNATLATIVQSASGRELTLNYPGGSQKITVPDSAAISTLVPGNPSQFVPGAPVNLTATAAGGALTALRVEVGIKRPK